MTGTAACLLVEVLSGFGRVRPESGHLRHSRRSAGFSITARTARWSSHLVEFTQSTPYRNAGPRGALLAGYEPPTTRTGGAVQRSADERAVQRSARLAGAACLTEQGDQLGQDALIGHGLDRRDVVVRQLSRAWRVRPQLQRLVDLLRGPGHSTCGRSHSGIHSLASVPPRSAGSPPAAPSGSRPSIAASDPPAAPRSP